MQFHLLECLKNGSFKPFPKLEGKRRRRAKANRNTRTVYCICRRSYYEEEEEARVLFMVMYSSCSEWFHKKWERISPGVFKSDEIAEVWECNTTKTIIRKYIFLSIETWMFLYNPLFLYFCKERTLVFPKKVSEGISFSFIHVLLFT